jgi:hypothetical protein
LAGNRIIANQVKNDGLSFSTGRLTVLRRQKSIYVNVPGFRIKCGMTDHEPYSNIYVLTIRANLRKPRLKIEDIIQPNFKKQSQFYNGSK